ncbi:MAG: polyprenyl synthetase family protein, partial [Sulfurimonas sp.]
GKPALHDFAEGKTTLPYIYLYEALAEEEKAKLESLHARQLSGEEQRWIQSQMKKYQIIDKSYLEAKALIEEAIALMRAQGEDSLAGIAREMIEREF